MDESQQRRLARNEVLFREVNNQIEDVAARFHNENRTHEFLCECSDAQCVDRLQLTREEYEEVRSDSKRFIVAKGHAVPEIERVVERASDHVVVEKEGEAADLAVHLDTKRH